MDREVETILSKWMDEYKETEQSKNDKERDRFYKEVKAEYEKKRKKSKGE